MQFQLLVTNFEQQIDRLINVGDYGRLTSVAIVTDSYRNFAYPLHVTCQWKSMTCHMSLACHMSVTSTDM